MTPLTARSLKITLVLDSAQVAAQLAPLQRLERRIELDFAVEGRTLHADFAPRAVRKCYTAICTRRSKNPSLKRPGSPVAPE